MAASSNDVALACRMKATQSSGERGRHRLLDYSTVGNNRTRG